MRHFETITIKQNHVEIMCNSARDILICMLSDTIHACAILIKTNWAVNAILSWSKSKEIWELIK